MLNKLIKIRLFLKKMIKMILSDEKTLLESPMDRLNEPIH